MHRLRTVAHIRHLPTAFRFSTLNATQTSQSGAGARAAEEPAPISLPSPSALDAVRHDEPAAPEDPVLSTSESSKPLLEEARAEPSHVPHPSPLGSGSKPPSPPTPRPAFSSEDVAKRFRSWSDRTKATIEQRAGELSASAATSFSQLGGQLNQITGYEEIEALKKQVVAQENEIQKAREVAREAKQQHEQAVLQRATSQREVNDLLSRKSTWSDDDVGRFTRLVRQDHVYEQAEAAAKAAAARAEDEVERAFSTLMRAILNRYHEEQVWSDKIRSASTYGSLAVLGLNVVVFVLATMFVEPWKRRRLAGTFERKVDEMDARNTEAITGGIGAIQDRLDRQERTLQQYAVAFTALQAASVQPTLQPPAPAESPNTTEPEPAPAETTLPPPSTPSLMSWRDWPAFVTQDNTRQAILAASSVAFVGGTVAGWLVRELRR